MLSGSGEALESTERRRRSPVLEVEDDGGGGIAGAPEAGGWGSSSRGYAVFDSDGMAEGLKSRSSKTPGS